MKKIYILAVALIGFGFSYTVNAQNNDETKTVKKEISMEVNDEGDGPTYKVKVITDKDGRKEVVERTYSSLEEMEADTSISVKSHKMDDMNSFTFTMDDDTKGEAKKMMVMSEEGKTITIKMDDGDEEMVWIEREDDDGHKIIKSSGGKVLMFMDDDDEETNMTFISDDGDTTHISKKINITVDVDDEDMSHFMDGHENVFIMKGDDDHVNLHHGGEGEDVLVWVDEQGNKTVKKKIKVKKMKPTISSGTISEVSTSDEDWLSFNLSSIPSLTLKSLNYYPNPNEGEFTLAFSGSKKPVIVRILDNKGNMKYESKVDKFDGNFNEVINLKGLDKGSYLMQVFQQGKVINRKVTLE